MRVLFIIDKVELKYFEFNKLVTNFWLIKGLLDKNCDVYISTISNLGLRNSQPFAICYKTSSQNNNIYYESTIEEININDFDLVMFRPDPPVDIDYINATYIFDFVKTKVINSPKAIRSFNEKLHSLYFSEFMTDSIVTASSQIIIDFLKKHKQIILKPMNRCFGAGVMYLHEQDPNIKTIINTLTNNETTIIMVQEFIPQVKDGDIRVLTLGERILPYCIKKLPGSNDFKFNTHNDSYLVRAELSKEDLEYFSPIAKKLHAMGIEMAGLDVINNKVIEINVTSPCYFIKEINEIYKTAIEKDIVDYLLTKSLLSL